MNHGHLPPSPFAKGPADAVDSADDHARSWSLIPWLVNGRAEGEQRRRALAHLQHCAACRAEWQAQQDLARAVNAEETEAQAMPDAEAGLQRLLGRLDQVPLARPERRGHGRLTQALAAAVVVQAVGLALLGFQLSRPSPPADYAALSQPASAAGPVTATVRLLPEGRLPLAEWQALLSTHGLVVVDGPNSAGAYGVAPRRAAAGPSRAELLARLRAAPGILLAEPLDGP
jgi:hypothetical protein